MRYDHHQQIFSSFFVGNEWAKIITFVREQFFTIRLTVIVFYDFLIDSLLTWLDEF